MFSLLLAFVFSFSTLTTLDNDNGAITPAQQLDRLELAEIQTDSLGPIFQVVEKMPHYPGCEHLEEGLERRKCATQKMKDFIASELKYPEVLRKRKQEGKVIVRFIVEKDGSLSDIRALRSFADEASVEAKRLIQAMNAQAIRWQPGTQRGKPVRVYFNLPIVFEL